MPDKKLQPRPSPVDAARRLVVLKYVVVYALAAPPPDKFRNSMAHGFTPTFSID